MSGCRGEILTFLIFFYYAIIGDVYNLHALRILLSGYQTQFFNLKQKGLVYDQATFSPNLNVVTKIRQVSDVILL